MKNMRESLCNNFEEKMSRLIGDMAVKVTDKAMGKCLFFGMYEPKFPIEIIKKAADK